ncbi:MAG: type IV pilus assembly protein PilY1 [Paraglaciecola sp.]|jgi:type IV pilus assembly protein PilY1
MLSPTRLKHLFLLQRQNSEVVMMYLRKFFTLVFSFFLTAMIAGTAMGDDLEIYYGVSSSDVIFNPNVLFIMDTSGSMGSKDGTDESRMLRVQNALKDTLSSITNVNAGLMRFSDLGGPVLYPVRPIDDSVAPELIIPITQGSDDAYEVLGVVNLSATFIPLSQSTNTVTTGLRYQNINIPQGATITGAYLRLTSGTSNTSATNIKFRAELSPDASTFTSASNDISSRPTTLNEVNWDTDNEWPSSGQTVSTPDFSSVLQEVVDQSGWCGGNDLNILIEATGLDSGSGRFVETFEAGDGESPQLVVIYDDTTATGCVTGSLNYQVAAQRDNAEERSDGYESTGDELTFDDDSNKYIGMRFQKIALPQGATISNAYLTFTAYQNSNTDAFSFDIAAADESNPQHFKRYPQYLLRDKPKTAAVTWSDSEQWLRNSTYQSPPITSLVQALVNRGDWQRDDAMILIVSNMSGVRGAYTHRGKPSGAVSLHIEYQGSATPGNISTVRDSLISKVDELSASGYTPIVDTLYEAALYYGGMPVDYGLARGDYSVSSTVRSNTRVSSRLSYAGSDSVLPSGCTVENLSSSDCVDEAIPAGATYISPITDTQCQTNNHIVLLSDGEANNNHSVAKIESLLGISCSGSGGEECGLELSANIGDTEDTKIDSRIVTHTIGFAANSTANSFLNQLALQGGGTFYQADDSAQLVDAFQAILKTVKDVNATFVSPGVAVNQLNRLTHKDELYFALFKPSEGALWPGNLKKYKISGDVILDQNGLSAVDDGTGFFSENSHSYWSLSPDGNDVREGGAASKMDLVRNIYTFGDGATIVNSSNELHENNSAITEVDLAVSGLADPSSERTNILKWARGVDVNDDDADGSNTDVRVQMGDPIHSQPVIMNYSLSDSAILVATNQGFLHSFDAVSGEENFAIIPRELLGNLNDFYRNGASSNHLYGLDGDMILRTVGDSKYLYVGMRRGGNNYYVFDITNKTVPSLVFKVEGGSVGYEKLGQTWSRPTITKINVAGTVREVMIFGGGYDEAQDSNTTRTADMVGNSVYIADANTGELIWSASNSDATMLLSDMQYSIPARVSVIDRESDGLADHMYVVDMGGQMFRLDINHGSSTSELVSGGLLADFGGASEADNRRFYYGPDVSEISLAKEHYYAVALGSGYRAHPLNSTINDHFYMLKDSGVFTLDTDGNYSLPETAFAISDMYDATDHLLTSSDVDQQALEANLFADSAGWMIRLGSGGEKVLASPLILDYQVLFTTYLPASASTSICAPPTGNSRAYLVNLINGNAVADLNNDGESQNEDRYAELKQTGIAPDTKILIEDIVNPVVCLGTECVSAVIKEDEDGNVIPCNSDFSCLAENIYGNFERVQKSSWKTETERP